MFRDRPAELLGKIAARLGVGPQDDDAPDRLALDLVGNADRRGLRDGQMPCEHRFDLRRTEALAGDAQRVVGASVEEPLAVLVDARPVAVDPYAGPPTPVRVEVALRVTPHTARHRGPRLFADELPHL